MIRYRHGYHRLDAPLHKVNTNFKVNEDQDSLNKELLKELFWGYLLPEMRKCDPLFNQIYRTLHYTGSSYEGLRTSVTADFDINLELHLPPLCKAQISFMGCPPGLLKIRCSSGGGIDKWLTQDGFIKRSDVLNWLKSVVDKALRKVQDNGMFQIRRSTSGPAVTLNVTTSKGDISVDLVPVMVFGESDWPPPPARQAIKKDVAALVWCAVPKAHSENAENTYWRMSFYYQEKSITNGRNTMKNAVRLLKLLRDQEKWPIASYFLKTVILWMDEEGSDWGAVSLGVVFMNTLSRLKRFMKEEKGIPFFWDKRHNLLSKVDPREIEKIGNRLEKIINKIDTSLNVNPDGIESVIFGLFGLTNSEPIRLGTSTDPRTAFVPRTSTGTGGATPPSSNIQPEETNTLNELADVMGTVGGTALVVGGLALVGSLIARSYARND